MCPRPTLVAALATLLLLGLVATANADLYTVEKDGVITITSVKPRHGRILHRVRDDKPAAKPKSTARRSGPRRVRVPKDEAARARRYATFVRGAAEHYGLPEALLWGVMRIESNFYPTAESNKGAQGLMQMLPGTWKDMGVDDPFDPKQNIYGGARYLRLLANRFNGDLVLTLSGYHAGGGAVNSAGGIPYTQTAEYVRLVLNRYYQYQKRLPTEGP